MHKRLGRTMFFRIFVPLMCVVLLQSMLFYMVTVYGGIIKTLEDNAVSTLTERTENRQKELSSRFSSHWTNMEMYSGEINKLHKSFAARYDKPLYADSGQQRAFLTAVADELVLMLRNNEVNGVFVILNNSNTEPKRGAQEEQSFYGLCIRDYDVNSGYVDREDLQVLRCPSAAAQEIGVSLDSYWEALYTFDDTFPGDYFYKPMQLAYENPGIDADNLAYFCGPHDFDMPEREVVSYSLPLLAADGTPYGVIGIELTTRYLSRLLPSDELLGDGNGAYMLVQYTQGSSEMQLVAGSGLLYNRVFGSNTSEITLETGDAGIQPGTLYPVAGRQDLECALSVSPLTIYNRNTPFEGEKLALVALARESALFATRDSVRETLLQVTFLVLLIGFGAVVLISRKITDPVKKLAGDVQKRGPADDTPLQHTGIQEIDRLVDAIEERSHTINQTKVRTEFFSRMSHDMRTPMNAIIGFSSPEVTSGCDKEQLLEYVDKINDSGKYLLGLINEVLDMTKIDSGHMELKQHPIETWRFWQSTVAMVSEVAEQKGVHFVQELPEDTDTWILGDAQRLSQMVVNLLSNAIKFTPAGGTVAFTVKQVWTTVGKVHYRIIVRDNGAGMSKEFQQRMYEPFAQEHVNREGTGLGLAITRQLVELMDGTILCESALGQGTTFTVVLAFPQATPPDSGENAVHANTEPELERVLQGRRVLLCEDHPINRQIAARLLDRYNIQVDMVENGEQGVARFAASAPGDYDAVLMDIRMPVMDGLQAAAAIRAMKDRPDAATVPIIAMTANAFQEDRQASEKAGMNAHLAKPVEPQQLYATLAELLPLRQDAKPGEV